MSPFVGKPIADYRDYLSRCVAAADRAFDATGYQYHKGAVEAYRDALSMLDKYPLTSVAAPAEQNSDSVE